jgi:hypothetical protein
VQTHGVATAGSDSDQSDLSELCRLLYGSDDDESDDFDAGADVVCCAYPSTVRWAWVQAAVLACSQTACIAFCCQELAYWVTTNHAMQGRHLIHMWPTRCHDMLCAAAAASLVCSPAVPVRRPVSPLTLTTCAAYRPRLTSLALTTLRSGWSGAAHHQSTRSVGCHCWVLQLGQCMPRCCTCFMAVNAAEMSHCTTVGGVSKLPSADCLGPTAYMPCATRFLSATCNK